MFSLSKTYSIQVSQVVGLQKKMTNLFERSAINSGMLSVNMILKVEGI